MAIEQAFNRHVYNIIAYRKRNFAMNIPVQHKSIRGVCLVMLGVFLCFLCQSARSQWKTNISGSHSGNISARVHAELLRAHKASPKSFMLVDKEKAELLISWNVEDQSFRANCLCVQNYPVEMKIVQYFVAIQTRSQAGEVAVRKYIYDFCYMDGPNPLGNCVADFLKGIDEGVEVLRKSIK